MSVPAYKVGNSIKVVYQSAGATTGLTIAMDVYNQAGDLVGVGPSGSVSAMAESGGGRYTASFVPTIRGDWILQLYDSVNNTGKVVKHYAIVEHDIAEIGDELELVKTRTDLLPGDPASGAAVNAKVDATEAAIIAEINSLESPAMVG